MSVCVAITTYEGHRDLLPFAIQSARDADQVLVIDNGWTCREIAEAVTYIGRDPTYIVDSRNIAQDACECDWLIHLDADDLLWRVPRDLTGDWCYADVLVMDDDYVVQGTWDYSKFPRTREAARSFARQNLALPTPMKAAFRMEWIRANGIRWGNIPTDDLIYGEDVITALRCHDAHPDVRYIADPFYCYRYVPGHYSERAEQFQRDLAEYLKGD